MEWTRAHRAQMRELLKRPEGTLPEQTLSYALVKDLMEYGYAVRKRDGFIRTTREGQQAWREGAFS